MEEKLRSLDNMVFVILLCILFETCSTHDKGSTSAIEAQTKVITDNSTKTNSLIEDETRAIRAQTEAIDRLHKTLEERLPAR